MKPQRPGETSSHRGTRPSIVTVASMETIADVQDRHVAILASHPQLTITRVRIGPGVRVSALHVHHTHTDAFYVLEGEITFELGPDAEQLVLGAGGFLAVPPGVEHAFLNTSNAAARLLNFHAPDGGFAGFLRGVRDGAQVTWDIHDVGEDGGVDPDQALVRVAGSGEGLTHANRVVVVKSDLPDSSSPSSRSTATFSFPTCTRTTPESIRSTCSTAGSPWPRTARNAASGRESWRLRRLE
jgi:quercetin dioxygenase-like cupin family protein